MRPSRLALFAAGALGLAVALGAALSRLPPVGSYDGAYGEVLNAVAVRRAALDRRGLGGELRLPRPGHAGRGVHPLHFRAGGGGASCASRRTRGGGARAAREPRKAPDSDAVRTLGAVLVPLTLSFGLYMVSHGAVSPGGGFQGGVVLASAPLIVYLCATAKTLPAHRAARADQGRRRPRRSRVRVGRVPRRPRRQDVPGKRAAAGHAGQRLVRGTIFFLNLTVGLAVAAGFAELLSVFVEERAEARDVIPLLAYLPYAVAAWLLLWGLYGVVTSRNLVHLVICLAVMQSSTYVLLLAIGYKAGAVAPVFVDMPPGTPAVDPVVQALMLTDVVVEATVAALLLALAVQAHERGGSLDPARLARLKG